MFDEDIKIAVPKAMKPKANDTSVTTEEYNRENP